VKHEKSERSQVLFGQSECRHGGEDGGCNWAVVSAAQPIETLIHIG